LLNVSPFTENTNPFSQKELSLNIAVIEQNRIRIMRKYFLTSHLSSLIY
jgi:hypothetical protein